MSEITIKEVEQYKEFDILLDGEIIGSAEIRYPAMTLNNFNIHPQHRGKGYGQSAIKQFVEIFGVTNLWVAPDNENAKHIYEKNGFVTDDNPLYIAMRLKGDVNEVENTCKNTECPFYCLKQDYEAKEGCDGYTDE